VRVLHTWLSSELPTMHPLNIYVRPDWSARDANRTPELIRMPPTSAMPRSLKSYGVGA
jgi:hypothetical protein